MSTALACALAAGYLAVHREDAVRLQKSNRLGLEHRYVSALNDARLVTHTPERGRAALLEAYALWALGRNGAADRAFAVASRLDPNNWVIHRDWSTLLLRIGKLGQAKGEFGRALLLNPRLGEAR